MQLFPVMCYSALVLQLHGQFPEEDSDSTELLQLKYAQSALSARATISQSIASQSPEQAVESDNFVSNPNFEDGITTETFEYTQNFPGWNAEGGTVAIRSGNAGMGGGTSSYRGGADAIACGIDTNEDTKYFVGMQGKAHLEQEVQLESQKQYMLEVIAAQRPNSPGGPGGKLRISIDGIGAADVTPGTEWERLWISFLNSGGNSKIRLQTDPTVEGSDQTVFIDTVTVVEKIATWTKPVSGLCDPLLGRGVTMLAVTDAWTTPSPALSVFSDAIMDGIASGDITGSYATNINGDFSTFNDLWNEHLNDDKPGGNGRRRGSGGNL